MRKCECVSASACAFFCVCVCACACACAPVYACAYVLRGWNDRLCMAVTLAQLHETLLLNQQADKIIHRTPWGGGKRRVKNLTNDTPPKKGFWTPPLVRCVFHPPQVSVLCFSCTKIHDRADRKLFRRGPKIFRESALSGTFSSPHTCTPPYQLTK